jgi:hypothetical protein
VAVDVFSLLHRVDAGGAGGLHLGDFVMPVLRRTRLMGDQTAAGIDDRGLPMGADLDLRDHVADQLEIDLGDADLGSCE